jgi:protein-tyrosine phosphatase
MASKPAEPQSEENIIRTFSLTRDDKPDAPPRKIVQVQCTSWPDFDVPDSPGVLIDLIDDVDKASAVTSETGSDEDRIDRPPVLVHCESTRSASASVADNRLGWHWTYWDVYHRGRHC